MAEKVSLSFVWLDIHKNVLLTPIVYFEQRAVTNPNGVYLRAKCAFWSQYYIANGFQSWWKLWPVSLPIRLSGNPTVSKCSVDTSALLFIKKCTLSKCQMYSALCNKLGALVEYLQKAERFKNHWRFLLTVDEKPSYNCQPPGLALHCRLRSNTPNHLPPSQSVGHPLAWERIFCIYYFLFPSSPQLKRMRTQMCMIHYWPKQRSREIWTKWTRGSEGNKQKKHVCINPFTPELKKYILPTF